MVDRLKEMYLNRPRKGFWAMLICGWRGHDLHLFSTNTAVPGWNSYYCRECGKIVGIPREVP